MDVTETRYTTTPDGLSVAYQVFGDGERDILFTSYLAGMEVLWDEPALARNLRRFSQMGRLVLFEGRGTGTADPMPADALPTPESVMDDVKAVLDAVGSTSVAFICHGTGCFVPIVFAAIYPKRVESVVLVDPFARLLVAEDYPIGISQEHVDALVRVVPERFGKGDYADLLAPSRSDDALRGFFGRWERTAFNRVMAQAWTRWTLSLDLRAALPLISARALVLHHERSRYVPAAFGEYVASHIPGARFVSIPGQDSYLFRPTADDVVDVIEEFITGSAPVHEPDRALATVLFTDVVSSTEHVARLGDRKWREVLDEHDALVVRELERHRGRKVNPTGDGMVATFDGPARGVRCARAIIDGVRRLGVEVRAGLHTGEVELRGDDIGGIAVHIGQRVSALAAPGEVLVSRTVTDLVAGSGLEFDERGEHELKGVPGKWAIYAVRP